MEPEPKPDIVFQQSVYKRERLMEKWPHLQQMIGSADEVAAAFETMERHPMWREDPRLIRIPKSTANEVLKLYNAVVADGRYIALFEQNPAAAARKLGIKVSKKALAVVTTVQKKKRESMSVAGAAIVVSVAVVGVAATTAIVSWHSDRRDKILIDDSGRIKIGSEKKKPGTSKAKRKKKKQR